MQAWKNYNCTLACVQSLCRRSVVFDSGCVIATLKQRNSIAKRTSIDGTHASFSFFFRLSNCALRLCIGVMYIIYRWSLAQNELLNSLLFFLCFVGLYYYNFVCSDLNCEPNGERIDELKCEWRASAAVHSLLMTFRINISTFKICNVLLPYGYIVFQCHDHDLLLILFYVLFQAAKQVQSSCNILSVFRCYGKTILCLIYVKESIYSSIVKEISWQAWNNVLLNKDGQNFKELMVTKRPSMI